jgi:hypothetical protein
MKFLTLECPCRGGNQDNADAGPYCVCDSRRDPPRRRSRFSAGSAGIVGGRSYGERASSKLAVVDQVWRVAHQSSAAG